MSAGESETPTLFDRFFRLNFKITSDENDWIYNEEPHCTRRKEILKKHPEIKKLMGYNYKIAFIVTGEVLLQLVIGWWLKDASWKLIFLLAYVIGGVLNHSLGSAIHEIGHNLAFGHKWPKANKLLSIFCNLPLGVPMALTYKKYHLDHHRYLGEEHLDVDIPTRIESRLFHHPVTKIVWLFFHPFIHGARPFYKSPKPLTNWELFNVIIQIIFDLIILNTLGHRTLIYYVSGTLMSFGLHPLAGHFISEHYLFQQGDHQATRSYYGPLNLVLFNVGYHIEHHDFPYIPYNKLPEVHKIAPEFYDNLPYHTSWIKVLWDFIFDKNVGPHSRGVGYMKYNKVK